MAVGGQLDCPEFQKNDLLLILQNLWNWRKWRYGLLFSVSLQCMGLLRVTSVMFPPPPGMQRIGRSHVQNWNGHGGVSILGETPLISKLYPSYQDFLSLAGHCQWRVGLVGTRSPLPYWVRARSSSRDSDRDINLQLQAWVKFTD